jgi:hypothetical protein
MRPYGLPASLVLPMEALTALAGLIAGLPGRVSFVSVKRSSAVSRRSMLLLRKQAAFLPHRMLIRSQAPNHLKQGISLPVGIINRAGQRFCPLQLSRFAESMHNPHEVSVIVKFPSFSIQQARLCFCLFPFLLSNEHTDKRFRELSV